MNIRQIVPPNQALLHPVRTAIAVVLSLLVARAVGLREDYWAPISTMVVMQSSLGAALNVSWSRLVGTALGCAAGAILVINFGPSWIVFGAGILCMGLLCAILRLDRAAYRFAGITLTIVMLASHSEPAWVMAIHRFAEVSLGIAVGVVVTAIWPERKGSDGNSRFHNLSTIQPNKNNYSNEKQKSSRCAR